MMQMRRIEESAEPIDFVITWVDGSDPRWLEEKRKYQPESDNSTDDSSRRYRDWGTLKYVFRGIESFAPWARSVFFITWGHIPDWLDSSAPKLRIIRHEDYIPRKYLPTFSSHPIELNMHRIPGLSEHFVYFNDDTFITQPLDAELFFHNGLPVLPPQLHGILPRGDTGVMAHVYVNNTSAINRHFSFHDSISTNRAKWFNPKAIGIKAVIENLFYSSYEQFPGFRHTHLPVPLLKSTIQRIWECEGELLDSSSAHRFRSAEDVNPYLLWQWQLASGAFVPCKSTALGRRYTITEETAKLICEAIRAQRYPLLCPNDMGGFEDEETFRRVATDISQAFECILPRKSRYEV